MVRRPIATAGSHNCRYRGPMNEPVPFTVRIRFPANYKLPAHWHPAVERITVLSGTFNMGVGDEPDPQKTTPLVPGSVAIMQPKTHHFALTKEETRRNDVVS